MAAEMEAFDLNLKAVSKAYYIFALTVSGAMCAKLLIMACQSDAALRTLGIASLAICVPVFGLLLLQGGLKDGCLKIGPETLVLEQYGRSVTIPYKEISSIAVAKVSDGGSFNDALVIQKINFARVFIRNEYLEQPDLIHQIIKRRLSERAPWINFTRKEKFLM